MGSPGVKNNEIMRFLIENSLLSRRQFEIIFNRVRGQPPSGTESRGAYYRVLRQARTKLEGVFYSLLLLEAAGVMDASRRQALERLARQVAVMGASDIDPVTARDVTRIVGEVVRRLGRV
jgi:hypothetical protein